MCEKIYGVDLTQNITPIMARDAIIECFAKAHSEILKMMLEYHQFNSEEEFEKMKIIDIKFLIKSLFREINADFDNPTKKDLIILAEKLALHAQKFRSPEIIKKHHDEIKKIIDKL